MGQYNIDNTTLSKSSSRLETDFKVGALNIEGPTGQKETEYMNSLWPIYWGYFNSNPDLKSAILMKAVWNIGKGYTADPETTITLDHISGWGKDTFDDILFNMEVQKRINGDAYAEIIRDDKSSTIINLKPLDPGSIKIIVDEKGIIKRYEQVNRIEGKETQIKFEPNEIFHLSNNRIANQIHGISDIKGMEEVLKADAEHFINLKKIMKQQVRPLLMFKLKTDIQDRLDKWTAKMDEALDKGNNFIAIPDDDNSVSFEGPISAAPNNIVIEWENIVRNKFYRTIGLPQIVPGAGGQSTESESKVIYFAFEQIVKKDQLFLEKQIWNQLNLKIKLVPPTSLMQDLQVDSQKDAGGIGVQLNQANQEEV